MVGGQLHDERSGIAGEHFGLLEHDAGDHDRSDADEISGGGDPGAAAEESAGNETDDRHLGAAGDKGRGHDRHAAVTLVFDGTGGHNARDTAAGADEHRDEALAGETELAEDTVHDEGDTRHVATVLKDAEHQEEDEHLGHEAEDRADAGEDTVGDQTHQPGGDVPALENGAGTVGQPGAAEDVVGPVGEEGAEGDAAVTDRSAHGQRVDQPHDQREDRQSQDAVRDDLVDLVGGGELTFVLFLVCTLEKLGNIDVTLVGDDALGVVVQLLFGSLDVLLDVCLGLGGNVQSLHDLVVALKDLDGVPALLLLGHRVHDGLLDMGDRVLHRAGEGVHRDGPGVLCGADGGLGGVHDARALQSGDLNDLAAELTLELFDIDAVAVLLDEVHHVQRDDHGDAELGELGGQVQVALEVRGVDDVQNRVRTLGDQIVTGDDLLQRVGGERVDARQVGDGHAVVSLELAFLLLDGDAGPVADELG